jgi:peroxiredoxin
VALQKKHRGLKVISISIDDASDKAKVGRWSKELKANFPILLDPEGVAAKAFDLPGIPHNVVLDRDGKVIGTAGDDTADLDRLVAKVVAAR